MLKSYPNRIQMFDFLSGSMTGGKRRDEYTDIYRYKSEYASALHSWGESI